MFRSAVFILCCCMHSLLAYRIDNELQQDHGHHRWPRGAPMTVDSMDESGQCLQSEDCKKDVWILWDNSHSVGVKYFKESVRPFLNSLINSTQLNVGPNGTHIGILTFSTQVQTKVLIDIKENNTKKELLEYLDQLTYDEVDGSGTRTGLAFKKADEFFPRNNPENYRSNVDDVVMILTDGKPKRQRGEDIFGPKYKSKRNGERLLATDRAKNLKDRKITVVGLAVGVKGDHRDYVRQWATSDDTYFEADIKKLNQIVKNLTCGICHINLECTQCGSSGVADQYFTAPGQGATIKWQEPTPIRCLFDSKVVTPLVVSPAKFGPGKHNITYSYILNGIKRLTCPVNINVVECKCSPNVHVNAKLQEGENESKVLWTVPRPSCEAKLINVSRPGAEKGEGWFPIGQHSVTYTFKYESGLNSFTFRCPITITVEGELCRGKAFNSRKQVCCCGSVHPRKPGYACCGPDYYSKEKNKCCENANLVSKQDSCPKLKSKISVH